MSVDEVPQLKRFEVVFERTVIVYAYDRPAAERTALTVETGHFTHTTKVVECNEVQSSADEPRPAVIDVAAPALQRKHKEP